MYNEIPMHTLWNEWDEIDKNTKYCVKKRSKRNSHMFSLKIKCFTSNYITNEQILFSLPIIYNLFVEIKNLLVYAHWAYSDGFIKDIVIQVYHEL